MENRGFDMSDIALHNDAKISMRVRKSTFARVLLYLSIKFESEDFVYSKEVANFLGCTSSYSNTLLNDFCSFGLIKKKTISGNMVSWIPVKNSNNLIINKYISLAKKTLGIEK